MSNYHYLNLGKTEKLWHLDSSNSNIEDIDKTKEYGLIPATAIEILRLMEFYKQHPVPNKVIKNVYAIYNPEMNQKFVSGSKKFQKGKESEDATPDTPAWEKEPEGDWRKKVIDNCLAKAKPFQDSDFPGVNLLPAWKGIQESSLAHLHKTGYDNLSAAEPIIFSKGTYFSLQADHAYRISPNKLIFNWIAFASPFPVIKDDINKLAGQLSYQNYDAYYIPLVPLNPQNPHEICYYPCSSIDQTAVYTQVVVSQTWQALPRYQIELGSESENILFNLKSNIADSAYFYIGEMLWLKGKYHLALPYLKKAAELKFPPAYLRLRKLYETSGLIGPKNQKESDAWHQKAAEQISWFQQQAKDNNPEGLFNLGWCYDKGIGVPKDYKLAFAFTKKAANLGHLLALEFLGIYFGNGQGIKQDYHQAFECLQNSSIQGNDHASQNLALCYLNGHGTGKDLKKAFELFLKLAHQGMAFCQYNTGLSFLYGTGTGPDPIQAFEWFQKGADQELDDAQYRLGLCYLEGKGNPKDIKRAMDCLQKAADQGHVLAQHKLGECYYFGEEVEKNLDKAIENFQKAAHQGYAASQISIGQHYLQDPKKEVEGLKLLIKAAKQGHARAQYTLAKYFLERKNYEKAFKWCDKAAQNNDTDAQYLLGSWYFEGKIIKKDNNQAFHWYSKAAEKDHGEAQFFAGYCYYLFGTKEDANKAFEYFQKSSSNGVSAAHRFSGICYMHGLGVAQDHKKALTCYQDAIKAGNLDANDELGDCHYHGYGTLKDYHKAFESYKIAADYGNPDAQYSLGFCFYNGHGTPKDVKTAFEWYEKSSKKGNKKAKEKLLLNQTMMTIFESLMLTK